MLRSTVVKVPLNFANAIPELTYRRAAAGRVVVQSILDGVPTFVGLRFKAQLIVRIISLFFGCQKSTFRGINLYKTQKICGNPQKEKGQKPNMGICPSSRRYMNYGKSMISLLHYLFYGYRTCRQPKIPSFYENNIYGTSYNLEDRIFSFLKWCRQKTPCRSNHRK